MSDLVVCVESQWYRHPKNKPKAANLQYKSADNMPPAKIITQCVRPPAQLRFETSIRLREALLAGVFFPTVWSTESYLHEYPYMLVNSERSPIVVPLYDVPMHTRYDSAQYVVVIQTAQDDVAMTATNSPAAVKASLQPGDTIIGVFERCV